MDKTPCVVCEKPLNPGHWWINLDNRTGKFIAPDAEPAHGEWGLLGIGRDCARRLVAEGKVPKEWIVKD